MISRSFLFSSGGAAGRFLALRDAMLRRDATMNADAQISMTPAAHHLDDILAHVSAGLLALHIDDGYHASLYCCLTHDAREMSLMSADFARRRRRRHTSRQPQIPRSLTPRRFTPAFADEERYYSTPATSRRR